MKMLTLHKDEYGETAVEFYSYGEIEMVRIYETNEKGVEEFAYSIPAEYIFKIAEFLKVGE